MSVFKCYIFVSVPLFCTINITGLQCKQHFYMVFVCLKKKKKNSDGKCTFVETILKKLYKLCSPVVAV